MVWILFILLRLHNRNLSGKYRENKTVSRLLMTVVGTELSVRMQNISTVILMNIQNPLRHHNRYDIVRITQTADLNIHRIEILTVYRVAVRKFADHFSRNGDLVICKNFIQHIFSSLFLSQSPGCVRSSLVNTCIFSCYNHYATNYLF